jgi:hypothetical protein
MARVWRRVFGLVGLAALALQYVLMLGTPGMGVGELTLNFFSYFTILTNVLMTLAMLIPATLPGTSVGRALAGPRLRSGVTLYAAVVGLVYHFLLHATWDPQGWLLLVNILLHYVMPAAMVLDWLMFTPKGRLGASDALRWLAFPLLYGGWTLIHGLTSGWWPYWFINLDALGTIRAAINFGGLLAFFLGAGLLLVLVDGLMRPRDRTPPAA